MGRAWLLLSLQLLAIAVAAELRKTRGTSTANFMNELVFSWFSKTAPPRPVRAQNWVDKWPGAVGHTNMLSSYLMADGYWNADCWCVLLLMGRVIP